MSPQLVLTVIGAINVLMGVAIYVGAENIVTGGAFVDSLITPESIKVGVYMHEALAASMIAIGLVALLNREMETAPAKNYYLEWVLLMLSTLQALLYIF